MFTEFDLGDVTSAPSFGDLADHLSLLEEKEDSETGLADIS
jgi:hypothetical protein